jgi:hypothetical protein
VTSNEQERCEPKDGCPKCGERRTDLLYWVEGGERVECLVCRTVYTPGSAPESTPKEDRR